MADQSNAEESSELGSRERLRQAFVNGRLSRRQFLKLLGATGVGLGAASILPGYRLTGMQSRSNPCSGGQQTSREDTSLSLDGPNNPEGVPVPDVAQGLDVGAKAGIEKEEFHNGPFHDITEIGAAMDGSTDDSAAIEEALRKSASDGGAAYIPEGEVVANGHRAIDITDDMNGATLVGDGVNSVIKGDGTIIGFFGRNPKNVTLANFRVDASQGKRGIVTPNENNNPGRGSGLEFNNLWVHGSSDGNIQMELTGNGNTIVTMKNMSVWGAGTWHGISCDTIGGTVELEGILSWENGTNDSSHGGLGVDLSGTGGSINRFLLVNNNYGAKTTGDTENAEFRNGAFIGNEEMGFYSSGSNSSANVTIDNVVAKGNGGEGFSFRASNYDIGTIWAIDNAQGGPEAENISAGIEFAEGASINADEIQVCGTKNGYPGINCINGNGSVARLVASNNEGGTFGSKGGISYGSGESQECSVPSLSELLSKS